jgi:hypothetical protein
MVTSILLTFLMLACGPICGLPSDGFDAARSAASGKSHQAGSGTQREDPSKKPLDSDRRGDSETRRPCRTVASVNDPIVVPERSGSALPAPEFPPVDGTVTAAPPARPPSQAMLQVFRC